MTKYTRELLNELLLNFSGWTVLAGIAILAYPSAIAKKQFDYSTTLNITLVGSTLIVLGVLLFLLFMNITRKEE